MDFLKDLGKTIVSLGAPLLGTAIGGPLGGPIAAIVADAFGVDPDDEQAIAKAVKADPQAMVKLKQIESQERVELERIAAEYHMATIRSEAEQIKAINQTMRAESKSEHWMQYSWRPFTGFVFGIGFLIAVIFTGVLAYQAVVNGSTNAMTMIPTFVAQMAILLAVPLPILGFASHHRGKEKRIKAGEGDVKKSGLLDEIRGMIQK